MRSPTNLLNRVAVAELGRLRATVFWDRVGAPQALRAGLPTTSLWIWVPNEYRPSLSSEFPRLAPTTPPRVPPWDCLCRRRHRLCLPSSRAPTFSLRRARYACRPALGFRPLQPGGPGRAIRVQRISPRWAGSTLPATPAHSSSGGSPHPGQRAPATPASPTLRHPRRNPLCSLYIQISALVGGTARASRYRFTLRYCTRSRRLTNELGLNYEWLNEWITYRQWLPRIAISQDHLVESVLQGVAALV
jgi:hypothetical protein